jgi:scyllo-inosose 3-dehydrogenase
MKALRLHAERIDNRNTGKTRSHNASATWKNPRLSLENLPTPTPMGDDLLIKVAYCGLCGSDYHLAETGKGPLSYPGLASLPVTIGHEFSGTVEGFGPAVSETRKAALPLGSAVTAEEMLWCGECDACRSGHLNHCEHLEEVGFTRDGGHAQYLTVSSRVAWSLEPLRKPLGDRQALQFGALVEPYAVSYRALFQGAHGGRWAPGLRVLVVGCGPIGAAALDLARLGGALRVDVLEPDQDRRALAEQLGADFAAPPPRLRKASRSL